MVAQTQVPATQPVRRLTGQDIAGLPFALQHHRLEPARSVRLGGSEHAAQGARSAQHAEHEIVFLISGRAAVTGPGGEAREVAG